jgi:predicted aldo/keto reductase-like oxidoreductase
MIYRKLGKTGLKVSVVGLGGIPIQKVNQDEAVEIIKECKNQGINFIDTARGYTVSEEYIGKGLKEVGRDNFYIATKAPAFTYQDMKKNIETSLEKLDVDYIDLYQVHNASKQWQIDRIVSEDGALKALVEAKKEGKIGHIGITSHNKDILAQALECPEFETIQFPFNPIENQGTDVFEEAKEKNIGIIGMKPIAGGVFREAQLSLRYIINSEMITIAIPGMDSVDQVVENAYAGKEMIPLTEEEVGLIDKEAKELGEDFCRRCGYCTPCPEGIDVPTMMILENYVKRYNLSEWAIERYKNIEIKASDCIECGTCETRCPYSLPIINRLKSVRATFE